MKDQKAGELVWDALPFNCTKSERGERDLWKKYKPLFTSDTPLIFRGIGDLSEEIRSLISLSGKSDAISPVLRLALLVDRLSERKYEKLRSVINSDKHVSPELMRDDTRLTIINEIITSKFADDLDMNRIAEDLYVSRRHLDRLVKSRFGSTIRELINDNRLDLAEKMLRSTSDSVEKISSDAGFSSKESFRRAFLKKYGLSPSEYRIEVSKKTQ
jgi:AraC-like DNA-binding protein